jgi:hypothetical protein
VDVAPAPPGPPAKISSAPAGVLSAPDEYKRKMPVDVQISTKEYFGAGETNSHTLKWQGLIDGVSSTNNVGDIRYQVILKSKFQTFLELTTMTPGLTPDSVDIYKNPYYSVLSNSDNPDDQSDEFIINKAFSSGLDPTENPLKFYFKLIKRILSIQQSDFSTFIGKEQDTENQQALVKIYNEQRYQRALQKAIELIDRINIDAVDGGVLKEIKSCLPNAMSIIKHFFFKGSNVILENILSFLNFLGLTIIFAKDEAYIIPERSFIHQTHGSPSSKKQSSEPNVAYPADYSGYSYNDNGYKDVLAVLLANRSIVTGQNLNELPYNCKTIGYYKDENDLTQASGVLILEEHPFFFLTQDSDNYARDAKDLKKLADSGAQQSFYSGAKKYGENDSQENQRDRAEAKKQIYAGALANPEKLKNYAQIKFYQARYGDRKGSVTISFNPKWVPGTGGTMFAKSAGDSGGIFLDFWVESVTHRVDMTAPAGGSAITIINFCCGRWGTPGGKMVGVDEDKFTGYNKGKEVSTRQKFLTNIGAS